jgi:hypothetical protein
MIHGDEWQLACEGDRLRRRQPYEQRPDQAGSVGGSYRVDLIQGDVGLCQSGSNHWEDVADMGTRGQFRYHATEGAMHVVL